MTTILVIEDDAETSAEIHAELTRQGFTVGCAMDGPDGLSRAATGQWDAIVIDRMLPGMDGLAVIRELRGRGVATPALVLSAMNQVGDRITGLKAGGDDYLVKSFALGELSARLEALIRRPIAGGRTTLHVGLLDLDLIRRQASRAGRRLDLLARDFQLLEFLMRREGQVVTRQTLLEEVFGYRFELKTNLIDVHMGRLRRKLEQPGEPPMLEKVRGVGFVLRAGS